MEEYLKSLKTQNEFHCMEELLKRQNLSVPENTDTSFGIFKGDNMIACGSRRGDILQGIAVSDDRRNENLSAKIVTALIRDSADYGLSTLYLFTKPENQLIFNELGFHTITEANPYAAFMEYGISESKKFSEKLREISANKPSDATAIVMNANPFTYGHRYLVEQASNNCSWVYLLAVEEDASFFPFSARYELMLKGTQDLRNVSVIPSGRYVVSKLTFPSYFTPDSLLTRVQAAIDAEVFADLIAPSLKVSTRYLGTEPYSQTTAIYNEEVTSRLSRKGITVKVLERKKTDDGNYISASAVRANIESGNLHRIKEMVPESTYQYILLNNKNIKKERTCK
jgi:[citrate (pro-3S)-lyase] ligase